MSLLPLRYPRLWLALGWLAVAFAVLVCLVPMNELPQPPGLNDKGEHILAYLLLSLWFCGIYPRSRYWLVGLSLFFMGIAIEFAQGAMHLGRQADVYDVIANTTGLLLGLALSWFGLGSWVQKIETLLSRIVAPKS